MRKSNFVLYIYILNGLYQSSLTFLALRTGRGERERGWFCMNGEQVHATLFAQAAGKHACHLHKWSGHAHFLPLAQVEMRACTHPSLQGPVLKGLRPGLYNISIFEISDLYFENDFRELWLTNRRNEIRNV